MSSTVQGLPNREIGVLGGGPDFSLIRALLRGISHRGDEGSNPLAGRPHARTSDWGARTPPPPEADFFYALQRAPQHTPAPLFLLVSAPVYKRQPLTSSNAPTKTAREGVVAHTDQPHNKPPQVG